MASVREIVAREFPERAVATVAPSARGNRKRTTFVTFEDGGGVVVQQAANRAALRTEAQLASRLQAETVLPIPAVLADGIREADAYVVVERAPGEDLHERFASLDTTHQQSLASTFGRYLATLHELTAFDAFGQVTWTDGRFVARGTVDWRAWFDDYLHAGLDALTADFDDVRAQVRKFATMATLPERPESRLYPWDVRPGNALVSDGRLTAILDWGDPLAADPGVAVAKAEHLVCDWYVADGGHLREAFRSGYERVRAYPTVRPVYRVAAVVHSAVDSNGIVTRPGFPERTGGAAVAFHRERLRAAMAN
ncbi:MULTISPECIES: phosphotransferase family protein [unclassified Haladaptatus]|uniref:phosphotransferase family protein n=1 Tax=unclassified Haladaptatus TaxID=2622732 RepID=UPI0023E7745F|nr:MULTISPECIES: phosphotransferase [unclassified Haladaptatus]